MKKSKQNSIYRQFFLLIVVIIIIPMVFVSSVFSTGMIERLNKDSESLVCLTGASMGNTVNEVVGSVLETSISLIGNEALKEYFSLSHTLERGEFASYMNATEVVKNLYIWNPYVESINIVTEDGTKRISSDSTEAFQLTDQEKKEFEETDGEWFWSVEQNQLAICRVMRNGHNVKERFAYIKLVLDETRLLKMLSGVGREKDYQYILLDPVKSQILLATDPKADYRIILSELEKWEKETLYRKGENAYCLIDTKLRNTGLIVVAKDESARYRVLQIGSILIIILLFVLLLTLTGNLYKRSISDPLEQLNEKMLLLNPGQGEPVLAEIEAKGEIRQLIDTFNHISQELERLYEVNYKNELKLRDASLLVLQQEINPHFLYNVLDSIRWMIALEQLEAASSMVEKLSAMFRMSLQMAEQPEIPLEYELAHAQNYIDIEKIRLSDKIHFQVNLQPEIESIEVIRFILQPLLENAIVHGIAPNGGCGNVLLSCYVSDGCLVYDIRDDGIGADPAYIQQILDGTLIKKNSLEGFALENIQSRLKIKYGKKYGMEYQRREGGGSVFIVRQPLNC